MVSGKCPFAGVRACSIGHPGDLYRNGMDTVWCSNTVDVPVYRPPVYRFALFTGVFFSCHPVTPVYRWYAGIPGWFIFSCSRSPSCCCTLPHTLLHTTQHAGCCGQQPTLAYTPCHVRQEKYANLVTALPPQNSPAAAHAEVVQADIRAMFSDS